MAVIDGLRGRGYEREVTEFLVGWICEQWRAEDDRSPRMTLWDVRDPAEAKEDAEKNDPQTKNRVLPQAGRLRCYP